MKFEIDFDDKETEIVQRYMKRMNMDISKVAKQAVLEMIFADDDALYAYEQAMAEYRKNPTTYTLDEVWKIINEQPSLNQRI